MERYLKRGPERGDPTVTGYSKEGFPEVCRESGYQEIWSKRGY